MRDRLTDGQKRAIIDSAHWIWDERYGEEHLIFDVPFSVRYEGASNSLVHDETNLQNISFTFKALTEEEIANAKTRSRLV